MAAAVEPDSAVSAPECSCAKVEVAQCRDTQSHDICIACIPPTSVTDTVARLGYRAQGCAGPGAAISETFDSCQ